MKQSVRNLRLAGALAVTLVLASACTAQPSGSTRVLTIAYPGDVSTVDPAVYYDLAGSSLQESVYEGLLRYEGDNQLKPALATSWDISADGMKYTFHLREGVKFQDGTAFDAAAVKASWEREAAIGAGPSYMVTEIDSIETPDDHTVIATLKFPDSQFLAYQASLWGPKIVSPTAVQQHSSGDPNAADWFTQNAVGTGPYQLTSFVEGQQYTLEQFKGYWGELASDAPDKIVIKIVPSTQTQQLLLTGSQVDMITHGLPFSQLASLSKMNDVKVSSFGSPKYWAVYMNTQRGPLADVRVRQAIASAVDRASIIQGIMFGFAQPPENTFPQGMLPGVDSVPAFDLAKAKGLLQQAGAHDIHLTYTYSNDRPEWGQIGQALKDQLAQIGVTVDLKPLTNPSMFGQILNPDKASDLMGIDLMGDTAGPESWAYVMWHSQGPLNFSSLSDPELDKAIGVASTYGDDAARQQAYGEIDRLVEQDAPAIFLAYPKESIVTSSRVASYDYVPIVPWTPSPWTIQMAR